MKHPWIEKAKVNHDEIAKSPTMGFIEENIGLWARPHKFELPKWAIKLLVQGTWMQMHEQDIHEAAIMWNMIDINDDGTISKDELLEALKEMHPEMAAIPTKEE